MTSGMHQDFAASNTTMGSNHVDFYEIGSRDCIVDDGKLESFASKLKRKLKKSVSKQSVFKKMPILDWLPKYRSEFVLGDVVAGVTVGLSVIPSSISFTNIAGLPPQYGLYSSFLGAMIYTFLGTSKDYPMGCTPIVSLLTLQAVHGMGPDFAVLLCFLTGVVQLGMGLLGLGFVVDYISHPVFVGFTYAVLLILVTSQLKDALGIPVKGFTFIEQWTSIVENVGGAQLGDGLITLVSLVFLLLLQYAIRIKVGTSIDNEKYPTKKRLYDAVNKTIWIISVSRYVSAIAVFGGVGYYFYSQGKTPFKVVGQVPQGLPKVQPPYFESTTNGTHYEFVDMLSELGWSTFVVPLLSMLESLAICRLFSNGNAIDVKQELLAVGTCNLCNSFVQAYPGGGSFTRSVILHESGVKTPLSNLYTGLVVIVSLLFLTDYFYYIPKGCLAAIILNATLPMLKTTALENMWKTEKSEIIPTTVTFLACLLLRIEVGIVVGIGVNLFFVVYHTGRPNVQVRALKNEAGAEYLLVSPDRWIIFTSAEHFRNSVMKLASRKLPVFVDCARIYKADYTSAVVVESMLRDFKKRRQLLAFCNLRSEVRHVLAAMSSERLLICESREDIDRLLMTTRNADDILSSV